MLKTILRHEAMPRSVVRNVPFDVSVVRTVHDNTALIRFANEILGNDRVWILVTHMKVDGLCEMELRKDNV